MKTMDATDYLTLSKAIGGRTVLNQIDLSVAPGECVILSGDNGAGKTTLLRILAGLLDPDQGQCQYNGHAKSWQQARPWLLHNVVYLHQEPYIFDSSVLHNISYGLRARGVGACRARAMAMQALHNAGLEHLGERSGKQLSGGEKQRVALLRAWVLSPRLLLLDEPIASLDQNARHRTLFLIRRLLEDGVGLIITAHEPRLFAPLLARHLRLSEGRLDSAPAIVARDDVSTYAEPYDRQQHH